MVDNVKLGVEVDAEVGGTKDVAELATQISGMQDALRDLISTAKSVSGTFDKVERSVAGVTTSTRAAQKEVRSLGKDLGALQAQRNLKLSIGVTTPGLRDTAAPSSPIGAKPRADLGVAPNLGALKAYETEQRAALKLEQQIKDATEATNKAREQSVKLAQQQAQTGRYATVSSAAGRKAVGSDGPATRENVGSSFGQIEPDLDKAETRVKSMENSLHGLRVSLYDVAQAFGIMGAAALVGTGLIVKAASDYQSAFADIQRTSGATGTELETLKGQVVDLATSIPLSFESISGITELGGQLGVPTARLKDFTAATAEFGTVTDVTTEAAATAFGRLDTLLPDVQGNYEGLGSAILQVGVNSVATESEIVATTSQIAAAGAMAGLTADQVIGLSASFASLGIAPEAARGTVLRVLGLMNQAISEGGASLQEFADIAGVSADSFASSWGTEAFMGNFTSFLQGVNEEGTNAQLALRGLGISAVRDQNNLLKLSQNTEVLTANLGFAGEGFANGTQLGDAFGIKAETVASQIQILLNNVRDLAATAGAGTTGPLTEFVKVLTGISQGLKTLLDNPVGQWVAAGIVALTAFAGVMLLVAAGFAAMGAGAISLRRVRIELAGMTSAARGAATASGELAVAQTVQAAAANGSAAATGRAGLSMTTLKDKAIGATLAMTTLSGVLKSAGIGIGLAVVFGGIAVAIEQIQKNSMSAADKAGAAFGDLADVGAALQKDTKAVADGAKSYGTVESSVARVSSKTQDWVIDQREALGANVALNDSMQDSKTYMDEYTYSIGENTKAAIANRLANDPTTQGVFKQNAKVADDYGIKGLDLKGVVSAAAQGDVDAAKKIIDNYREYASKQDYGNVFNTNLAMDQIKKLTDGARELAVTTGGMLDEAAANIQIGQALGITAEGAAAGVDALGDAAESAGIDLDALSDAMDAAFAIVNANSNAGTAFQSLAEGLIEAGTGLNVFSAAGANNVSNLQAAIEASIQSGAMMGQNATESVSALFVALQKQGIDTANLLAQLSNMNVKLPGVDMNVVAKSTQGQQALSASAMTMANAFKYVAPPAKKASGGIDGVGKSAKKAKIEVVTLKDYANDLRGVFDRAFELRFGRQDGLDKITKGWQAIAEATKKANDEIKKSQATLKQLTADKAIQEYFLGVAENYGDTLRGDDIKAKLADINDKIAEETQNVTDSQADASKELTGNSKAAIENRSRLTDLVGEYQGYIEQLASSGMSTADMQRKTADLKNEFYAQAQQLGYNRDQVSVYARSFDDLTQAIGRVPRNVTVAANTDPAKQALQEFIDKANAAKANATVAGDRAAAARAGQEDGAAYAEAWKVAQKARSVQERTDSLGNKTYSYDNFRPGSWVIRAKGGPVSGPGTSTSDSIPALLSDGEYVINAAAARKLGSRALDSINNGNMPAMVNNTRVQNVTSGGGMPHTVVAELSPYDRALLAAVGNTQVKIGGEVVARVVNANSITSARNGGN